MTTKTGFTEKRKHKRFKVKEGAFAEFHKPHRFKLGKPRIIESAPIINVSLKGLAFQYIARDMWSSNFNELVISSSETADEIKIDKVPFKAVSDFAITRLPNSMFSRRCSIKFRELTPAQKSQLDHFIQNHTIGNRRSGSERRQFSHTDHSPEQRSDEDRRGSHRNGKSFIERRKRDRFKVRGGAFVSIKSDKDKVGPIRDINRDGFAFRYIGEEGEIYGPLEVDIFYAGSSLHVKKVKSKTIADFKTEKKASSSSLAIRQCCVQFCELTEP